MTAATRRHLSKIHTLTCVENWRDVPGWEGLYEVSDLGRIRSLARTVNQPKNGQHIYPSKVLSPIYRRGYQCATLTRSGVRTQVYVHRVVLKTFCGEPSAEQEACHNNGDRADNRLSNLRWDTRRANMADKVKHGTQPFGTQSVFAKLTEETVRAIRLSTESAHAISRRLGIHVMTISKARNRKTWKHVK